MAGYEAYGYGQAGAGGADPYAPGGYGGGGYGAPPPAYGGYPPAYAAAPYGAAAADEVRTVFITGFPNDVKERELNNMLRFMPGYEASQMNFNKGQAQGFALFTTGAYARAACEQIQHVTFDEVSTLRAEMARKNMYIKDMDATKRPRMSAPAPYGAPYGGPPGGGGGYRGGGGGGGGYAGGGGKDDNAPCNTLFVGNLGDYVQEEELRQIFGNEPGFRQVKLVRGKALTAFVEFDDVPTAMAAHAAKQGAVVASNDRGGIRLQYSKNPLGKKRDLDGRLIDTPGRGPGYGGPYDPAAPGAAGDYPPPGAA